MSGLNVLRWVILEPYITYGCPNLKAVRDLVYKRGFVKVCRYNLFMEQLLAGSFLSVDTIAGGSIASL